MGAVFVSPLWCQHGRTGDTCEDCRIIRTMERGGYVPKPVTTEPAPDPVHVDTDTHVERTDLGSDVFTFVSAGDAIPARLVDMPRHTAKPAEPVKPERRNKRAAEFG